MPFVFQSMSGYVLILSLFLWSFALFPVHAEEQKDDKIVVGWVENVYLESLDSKFQAKLDTGAKTSSLGADIIDVVEYTDKIIEENKRSKKPALHSAVGRIIFMVPDAKGVKKTLERDIIRWVRIKRKGNAGFIRRPVVHMRFCLAGHVIEDEVNLAVRDRFIYPVLIGRNMLEKGRLVVDAAQTLTAKASCRKKQSKS
ncbi:MAG: RimK/LysX family protein [Rickettsiales bacterium]|nr:RimK/LysX family protein [Rickettsiales bacterium]